MPQLQFFATKNDLLPVLESVEQKMALKYALTEHRPVDRAEIFLSVRDLPNLGVATHESASSCNQFLVVAKEKDIYPRALPAFQGKPRFAFDQLENPETVVLNPGGWWKGDILLYGMVGTASDHPSSLNLMKLYASAIRKQYTKIKGYYVGAEAQDALKAGKRLTIAAQSPPQFNLAFD